MNQSVTTVLIADDEPSILALTAVILEGAGYNVLRAVDGRQALKLGCQHHAVIDVALVDYVMPGMVPLRSSLAKHGLINMVLSECPVYGLCVTSD